jgi:hypothetical protein
MDGGSVSDPPADESGKRGIRPIEWVAGSAIAVAFTIMVISFFTVDVCDQQVAEGGETVRVCRHLQIDDPPVVVLGLIVLTLLGIFFSEISGFGVTLKRSVETASRMAKEAQEDARQAREEVEETVSEVREGVGEALSRSAGPAHETTSQLGIDGRVAGLAARYNELRWTMPSGQARTHEMHRVFNEMVHELRDASDVQLNSLLASRDRGIRLAGIAYLNAKPDISYIPALAATALYEDKPFGEFMAWVTLRQLLKGQCDKLDPETRNQMMSRLERLPSSSDRAAEIRGIFRECPPGPQT